MKNIYLLFFILLLGGCGSNKTETPEDAIMEPDFTMGAKKETEKYIEEPPLNFSQNKNIKIIYCLDEKTNDNINYVYSVNMRIAWEALKKYCGETPDLTKKDFQSAFPCLDLPLEKNIIDPDAVNTYCGDPSDIPESMRTEMDKKFPGMREGAENFVLYSHLSKKYKWARRFEKSELSFSGAKVKSFLDYAGMMSDERYSVIYYGFEEKKPFAKGDIVLKFMAENSEDEIILAMIKPEKSLELSVKKVMERVAKKKEAEEFKTEKGTSTFVFPSALSEHKKLEVPCMNFEINKEIKELAGATIKQKGVTIDGAAQSFKLLWNENGASVEDYTMVCDSSAGPGQLSLPDLIIDKPFLLYFKKKNATEPYFVMWVNNAEILVPAKK